MHPQTRTPLTATFAALAIAGALACARASAPGVAQPPVALGDFPEGVYAGLPTAAATGSGTVRVRVTLGDPGARRDVAVVLLPETPYSTAWVRAVTGARPVEALDRRASAYSREAVPDADGVHTFRLVPPGRWYLVATVTRIVPSERCFTSSGGVKRCLDEREAERFTAPVTVGEGQAVEVTLGR